jgi:hypothetical protein
MSSVAKKCPKDGIVYDAAFTGNCASCFGPLKFFCKTHNEWLEDARCPKCDGSTPSTAVAPAAKVISGGPSIVGVLAVLAICVGVFVLSGMFLYRAIYAKPKAATVSPVVPQSPSKPVAMPSPLPAPVTPAQTPSPAPITSPPATTLSLGRLLADADQFVGKPVAIAGQIQFRDAGKQTFDLRDGDYILTVQYRDVPPMMKTTIAAASSARLVKVTGWLRRDDADNSFYLVARSVEMP